VLLATGRVSSAARGQSNLGVSGTAKNRLRGIRAFARQIEQEIAGSAPCVYQRFQVAGRSDSYSNVVQMRSTIAEQRKQPTIACWQIRYEIV
jgi:hypothetical protein